MFAKLPLSVMEWDARGQQGGMLLRSHRWSRWI